MKRTRHGEFDPSFTNATLEEMAARIKQREQQTNRKNYIILLIFFLLLGSGVAVGAYFYGHWVMETVRAAGHLFAAIWHLEWWQAISLLLEYKLSFLILGIVIGFGLFLFITLQIGEMLVDLIGDLISSLFN
jgi:hypothetical protein